MKFHLVSSENGVYDFDVTDAGSIKRVKVPESVKAGDIINIYSGESTKTGAEWKGTKGVKGYLTGDLELSVRASNAFHVEIVNQDAQYCIDSGYTVVANNSMSTVVISNSEDDESSIYLDGSDADEFIEKAKRDFESLELITMDEALLHHAKPYIENLS
ncbi:hypothetical protein [Vibrio sp. D431a]|uniref:hypothetical protein n=1 Tax=Vibrio sp. D431a TaxID=2837388 RepID=UPI002556E796|nr:hypothetical protein [Vibrio sp. D431a]MDK9793326.1 hypothetical protein [Vibrio sp. D431a]